MRTVSVGELKANFSDILNLVQNKKEEIIIEFGKKHKKIAMIVPYIEKNQKREFGIYEGKYKIPEDFNNVDTKINKLFYESEIF